MELKDISGIGEVRRKSLENNGIFTTDDLINYFPYKYYDFTKSEPFSNDGNIRLILSQVAENPKLIKTRTNLVMVTCKMIDESGNYFTAVWYNQTYIKSNLFIGMEIYLYGKNSNTKKGYFTVMLSKEKEKLELGFLPVYHSIDKIGQKTLHDCINYLLQNTNQTSFVSEKLQNKYKLMDLNDAYFEIHNPKSEIMLNTSLDRVEIENLIPIIAINEFNKLNYRQIKTQKYLDTIKLKEEYQNLLPYKLTVEQNKALFDIEKDLSSKFSMNRLLQGDVGSGKTAVSFYGAFVAVKNGYQVAISAPTEILAHQHYEFANRIFGSLGVEICLITGSTSKKDRLGLLEQISDGRIKIIIGTHSIFSDDVIYNNLSYIVIDEQHRFGVEQRRKLKEKGTSPDILVMSATPIPRSLSLVVYGDLDLTTITERPKPLNIVTNLVNPNKQNDMWNYISERINNGSRVYVVCSKIDEENENESMKLFSANNMYEFLKTKFDKNDIALIHGRISREKQNKIFEDFRAGNIKILVSTTIVEVGVDIPETDIMVIATPERFGLATLHQIRGRVGRNGLQSYCFCLTNNLTEKSAERLLFFKNHSNGFEIADFDLANRGGGSILGTNQHGNDNGLFGRFSTSAYSTAKEILENCKKDVGIYTKILEKGEKIYSAKILGKIILN